MLLVNQLTGFGAGSDAGIIRPFTMMAGQINIIQGYLPNQFGSIDHEPISNQVLTGCVMYYWSGVYEYATIGFQNPDGGPYGSFIDLLIGKSLWVDGLNYGPANQGGDNDWSETYEDPVWGVVGVWESDAQPNAYPFFLNGSSYYIEIK